MLAFERKAFDVYNKDWALVTAGTADSFNTMTVSWGGLGTLWSMPTATIYIKPIRYTHEFLKRSSFFTISFYEEAFRDDLRVLGTLSGRDCDKLAKTGLTPKFLENGITFEQAAVTLVCRKIYEQDMIREAMPENVIRSYYMSEAPHTIFIGEVVDIIETGACK